MVEQQFETTKVNEAEEVFDVVLPASDQPAKIVQPSEEPFHFPTPTVAAQFPSILGLVSTLPVRGDQFDVVFVGELFVERVGVVGFVADESGREFIEKASGKNLYFAKM
jgi:hypothetical protein